MNIHKLYRSGALVIDGHAKPSLTCKSKLSFIVVYSIFKHILIMLLIIRINNAAVPAACIRRFYSY